MIEGRQARALVELHLRTDSPEATRVVGRALGQQLEPGHLVGLVGTLGTGKTCFVQGVAQGAGVPPEAYVASPTFVIATDYPAARFPLYHMDVYRLSGEDELIELGYEDYWFSDGACLVEWFDLVDSLAPSEHLRLELSRQPAGGDQRELSFCASGPRHQQLLAALVRSLPAHPGIKLIE